MVQIRVGDEMQSIILITDCDFNFDEIIKHWNGYDVSLTKDQDRIVIELREGRIYIDLYEDWASEYEPNELEQIDIEQPCFYSILYSDILALKRFIRDSLMTNKLFFIDDDRGKIIKIKDLKID